MSGFWLKCWSGVNKFQLKENNVVLSKELYFCKGRRKMKNIVLSRKGIR